MAKGMYVGVNNAPREVKKIYVGVNGVARKVKKVYVGVNGVARQVWSAYGFDSLVKLPNPAILPSANGKDVAFSGDGSLVATVGGSLQYSINTVHIYKRNGDAFTKLANIPSMPDYPNNVAFSADGNYLAVSHTSYSPTTYYLRVYKRNGDSFISMGAYAGSISQINGVTFSPNGLYLFIIGQGSPYIRIYKRNGDTFTLISDTLTLPAYARCIACSPDSTYFAVGLGGGVHSFGYYKIVEDTVTKMANPSKAPTEDVVGVAFGGDGTHLVTVSNNTPTLSVYRRSGDSLIFVENPTLINNAMWQGSCVDLSSDGQYLAYGTTVNPNNLGLHKWNGYQFAGLNLPNPAPAGHVYGVAFNPVDSHLAVAHNNSPFLTIYKGN